jgi:hypothetical protein
MLGIVDYVHAEIRLAQNSISAGPSVTYLLRKADSVCSRTDSARQSNVAMSLPDAFQFQVF